MAIKGIARSCLGDVFESDEELDKLTHSYHKCWNEMEVYYFIGHFKFMALSNITIHYVFLTVLRSVSRLVTQDPSLKERQNSSVTDR